MMDISVLSNNDYGLQIVCTNNGVCFNIDHVTANTILECIYKQVCQGCIDEYKSEFVKFELSIKRYPIEGQIAFDFTPKK